MDLDKFEKMDNAVSSTRTAPRFYGDTRQPVSYVCTICGKAKPPTLELNLRCGRCNTPLIRSLERVQKLQTEIKRFYMHPESVKDIQGRIRTVRQLKQEFADAVKAPTPQQKLKQQQSSSRQSFMKDIHLQPDVLVYEVWIKPRPEYPDGFQGLMEIPDRERVSFERKAKKIGCRIALKGTRKQMQRLEEIRRAVVSVIKEGEAKREATS